MASRWVWEMMGIMLMFLGMFGKFGAALAIIPDPIIGALQLVGLGKPPQNVVILSKGSNLPNGQEHVMVILHLISLLKLQSF